MANDALRYTFKIEDFTPETMPFGRLVKYYAEITRMIGVADNLHLINVVKGSHGSTLAIDRNYESTLVERLSALNNGTAPKSSLRARGKINEMLKEDGTSGVISSPAGQNVIIFPGKRPDESVQVQIRDAATFTGELYHIAGTKDDAKIRINTETYGVVFCTTTRDIAKALRDFLFEDVKVSGRGLWTRNENGVWDIDDFSITDFSPVRSESLRGAVNRLRTINMKWPKDPLGDISDLENKNGPVH